MPNPYLITAPTLIYDFSDSESAWTKSDQSGVTGTKADSAVSIAGSNSLHLTATATNSNYTRMQLPGQTWDMSGTGSGDDLIHIRVYHPEGDSGIDRGEGVGLRVSFGIGWSPYAWSPGFFGADTKLWRGGWQVYTLKKSDYAPQGGWVNADWASVTQCLLYMKNVWSGANQVTDDNYSEIIIDSIWLGGTAKPAITFSVDDADASVVGAAADLDAYNWKLSNAIYATTIGVGGSLTLAEVQTLHAQGHKAVNHSNDHIDADGAVIGDLTQSAQDMEDWLTANVGSHPQVYVYPYGRYTEPYEDYIKDTLGYHHARLATLQPNPQVGYGEPSALFAGDEWPNKEYESNVLALGFGNPVSGTSALAIAEIDAAIARGKNVHIYWHIIVPSGASLSSEYNQADFDAVLAHIKTIEDAGNASVMAYHEWAESMNGLGGGGPVARRRRR